MKVTSYYRTNEPNLLGGFMCYYSFNQACNRADDYKNRYGFGGVGAVFYRVFVDNVFKYELQIR